MTEAVHSHEMQDLLAAATQDVLETMFFMAVLGPAGDSGVHSPMLQAELRFHGRPSGMVRLAISRDAARTLASGFLGFDAEQGITETEVEGVTCELLNVIAGTALSRLGGDCVFDLESPRPITTPFAGGDPAGVECALEIEDGVVTTLLVFEE